MTIQNEENQNTNKEISRMYFLERAAWKRGQEIITVRIATIEGKQKPVGHIYIDFDLDNKLPVYISVDSKGNQIFPRTQSLYDLKKKFTDNEKELALKIESPGKSYGIDR